MSKPHIRVIKRNKFIDYYTYDNDLCQEYIGSTTISKDGKLNKSIILSYWLNNPENVKKYLKTPINPNNTELTEPPNYLDIGDSFSKQYIDTKEVVRVIGWRNI